MEEGKKAEKNGEKEIMVKTKIRKNGREKEKEKG